MFPTSSRTFLTGRNVRSAAARVNLSLVLRWLTRLARSLREQPAGGQLTTLHSWYVHPPVSGGMTIPRRACAHRRCAAAITVALALASCGGSAPKDPASVSGTYEVTVARASFPAAQRLSEHTHMVIAVRNAGARTIPNISATVCNVTCAYPAPPGEGTSAGPFAADINDPDVGNPTRPTWIVDRAPGPCLSSCQAGGAGSAVTAYSNTWTLGPLAPGQTKVFDWNVTAVSPGKHVVAWMLAAALTGSARAVLTDGSAPQGTFTVAISSKPVQSYVSGSGRIVTTS